MKIVEGRLDDPKVQKLLLFHFESAQAQTAEGSAHALDLSELKSREVLFWSAWEGEEVVGTGALKALSGSHGELKSMHTHQDHRRKGIGRAMLQHIIAEAGRMGFSRLSLETGSSPFFAPARALYLRNGFVECSPFGDYTSDPHSVFMMLDLNSRS